MKDWLVYAVAVWAALLAQILVGPGRPGNDHAGALLRGRLRGVLRRRARLRG
jgi:hypothetical protein